MKKIYKNLAASLTLVFALSIQSCKETKKEQIVEEETSQEAVTDADGFMSIFDGKTLEGWEGDPKYWSVENGNLTGTVTPETLLENNTFIVWQGGQPSDFELKLEFKIAEAGNSGINYRSEKIDTIPHALRGYQADIDGKTLEGWEGDPKYWSVKNGNLTGTVTPETLLENNTFIVWQGGQPSDFELKLEFKIADAGNSGINYRSEKIDTIPHALRGYQADIDGKIRYTGQNYEEKKRATLAYRGEKVIINTQDNPDEPGSLRANVQRNCWQSREVVESLGESDSLKTKINHEDWNEVHLVIKGNRLQHYVNGVLMSDVTDEDSVNRMSSGHLGVQVHVGPPMKVEFKNIRLKEL